MELRELTDEFITLQNKKEEIKVEEKEINRRIKALEELIIDDLVQSCQQSAKFPGLATIGVTTKKYPRVVNQLKFFQYLERTNQDGMVKQTVNHNTLKSWFKGAVIEEDLESVGLSVFEEPKIYYRRIK